MAPGHAIIGDGEILAACLMTHCAGRPALADASRPCDEEAVVLADPVAAGERHEQIAVEAAGGTKVGILDLRIMGKLGSPGAGFEMLLAAHGGFAFEQDGKPFSMLKTARFGLCVELL